MQGNVFRSYYYNCVIILDTNASLRYGPLYDMIVLEKCKLFTESADQDRSPYIDQATRHCKGSHPFYQPLMTIISTAFL